MKHIPAIIQKSSQYAFDVLAGISTIAGVAGYTVRDICTSLTWWQCLLILFAFYVALFFLFLFILRKMKHRGYTTDINGKPVTIKVGDLFHELGWKLIPFNERFDTVVDDKIIAHNTLNGVMIDKYVSDKQALNKTIADAKNESSALKPKNVAGNEIYPLGRIITYHDFMMLAFTHFDNQNKAYVGIEEYELVLSRMWEEMRRTYAARKIAIPLIGTGITDIKGMQTKDYTWMVKCILCTLRNSGFKPDKGLAIVLTEDAMDKIDMNTIREEF